MNNMFPSHYYNPYVQTNPYTPFTQNTQQQQVTMNIPQQQVPRVAGENGARAYPMGPNSSAILLDESGVMAWIITTDAAGYKNVVKPYDLIPHKVEGTETEKAAAKYDDLSDRVTSLAMKVTQLEDIINGYSGNTTVPTTSGNGGKSRKPGKSDDNAD